MPAAGPILGGMRVVELSAFVAAPLVGSTLAELGAEVIRIEPPGGGIDAARWPVHAGRSLYRAGLDQGKRSVTIDTRGERGQRLVADLIAAAGIFVTNLPDRDWCSYQRLSALRPDLIMASIVGNPDGSTAVDYTVNASVGFPWVTGPEDAGGPVNHVLPAWDLLTGYLMSAGIVAAELHRQQTGEGQLLRVSLADVALSIAGHLGLIAEAQHEPRPRGRYGNYLYGSYSCDFGTSDSRRVIVVALTARQWNSLVDATSIREGVVSIERRLGVNLAHEAARFEARREISALIEPWMASRRYSEVRRIFDEHGVLWGPYQTFKELVAEDPRCGATNPLFGEVEQPDVGRTLVASSPLRFSRSDHVPPAAAPRIGGDTDRVLATWLGLSQAETAALRAQGVVSVKEDVG